MNKSTLLLLATWTLAGALLSGCTDDGSADDADPKPTPSSSTTGPTPTTPAWQSKFTAKQLQAYEAALARWDEYQVRAEPIWSRGEATRSAAEFFRRYFPSPIWKVSYRQLEAYEEAGIVLEGRETVFWSKPKRISQDALTVVLVQCVDYTTITGTQNGEAIEREAWAKLPRLQTISLSKPKGHDWLIYSVQDATSQKRPQRCAP